MPGAFALLCRCGKKKELCAHPAANDDGVSRVLLPTAALPIKYWLSLELDLEKHIFEGRTRILFEVLDPSAKSITLHAKDLTFKSARFEDREAVSMTTDEKAMTVCIAFGDALGVVASGELIVEYTGVLNNLMAGFYRSEYVNIHGEKKLMASTQFESIDARRCFPCFDEPQRKATFECELRIPAHMTALSNMPEACVKHLGDGTKRVQFMESPRMSTYLLAFVVGEFDHVSSLTKNGVLIRAFTPPGKPELGRYALQCAVAALDAYDETFQIKYPLPKSDMVAIPEFAAGAMENWGLVTYREVDMLIDEQTASSRQKQRVAEVVIHELAHQWFGNLVTMEWWRDLWLNEGFATYLETGICAKLHPDWSLWEQFISEFQGRALSLDALRSSHPIQVPIVHAEEVEQVFDAISYCKGGSVVRMVHAVVGEDKFIDGLRAYMREFKYGNATTEDLWAAWELASGKPIKEMMAEWTMQTGFPMLEVVAWDPSTKRLELRQSRFLADGSDDETNTLWTVPVVYGPSEQLALMPRTQTATLEGVEVAAPWLKVNAGQHVPLRVKYPAAMYPLLARHAIKDRESSAADRIGLVSDAAALSRAGKLSTEQYLEILFAYEDESEPTVVSTLVSVLLSFSKTLRAGGETTAELRSEFDTMARDKLLEPRFKEFGWTPRDSDGHLSRKLRGELVASLPTFCQSSADVVAEATRRFDLFADGGDKNAIPTEYQSAVYKLVLMNAHDPIATFDRLLALHSELDLNEEKKSVLIGLGAAPTDDLRGRALDFALDNVKMQDFFYVALSMNGSSLAARDYTWKHFQANLERYKSKVGDSNSSIMDAVISGACSGFGSAEQADSIEAFFSNNPLPRNDRKIAQVLETIRTTAKCLDSIVNSPALAWFKQRSSV